MNVSDVTKCINGSLNIYERYKSDLGVYNQFTVKHLVEQITVPILVCLGLPGTIFSFIIWTRKQMRYSSSIYLTALAISDSLFIIGHIVWHLDSTYNIPVINNRYTCNIFPVFNLFLQYMSPILTLAFTVERYISICWPFSKERLCSINRAITVSVVLFIKSFCIALPMLYFFRFDSADKNRCLTVYEIYKSLNPNDESTDWLFIYNIITESIMFACIPFIILIINIRVIVEMWKIYRSSKTRIKTSERSHKGATTLTLLSVSFYLICASLPLTIVHLYGFYLKEGDLCLSDSKILADEIWRNHFRYVNIQVFIEFFTLTYYGAKFYIYLGTSETFRTVFLQLFVSHSKAFQDSKSSRIDRKIKYDYNCNKCRQIPTENESVNLLSISS